MNNHITTRKKMKNNILKIAITGFLFISLQTIMAQVVTSIYFMDNLPQSNTLNPAITPNYKFYIGLPIINNTNATFSSDIGLNDVYNNNQFFWNSQEAYNDFVNGLEKTSYLSAEFNTDLLNFGFRAGDKGYVHFAINHRMDITMGIPQDFFKLNDLTINHDMAGFEMQARWYSEYALGYSRIINDQITVGARLKYIAGVASSSVTFDQFNLDTQYEMWKLQAKGTMNISAPVDIITDEDGYPTDFEETIDTDNVGDLMNFALFNYGNPGFGIDLGVEYKLMSNIKLYASLIDLGKINWKTDVTNFSVEGEYAFEGVEDLITTDNDGTVMIDDDAFEALEDSIKSVMTPKETNNSFSNTLSPKLFIGAEYEFTETLSAGILYKAHFIREQTRHNIYLNANANLRRFLTFGVNYNFGLKGMQDSFGGVIGFNTSPVNLYFAADVIPGYAKNGFSIITDDDSIELPIAVPKNFGAFNFQLGINIVIGKNQKKSGSFKNNTDDTLDSI